MKRETIFTHYPTIRFTPFTSSLHIFCFTPPLSSSLHKKYIQTMPLATYEVYVSEGGRRQTKLL